MTKSARNKLDFTDIYKKNLFGSGESVSGTGSEVKNTDELRSKLVPLLKKLGVRTFLDVPCGDFNWMKLVDFGNIKYIGGDIVEDLSKKNQAKFGNEMRKFQHLDITSSPLPRADAIFCRDCLVHLTYAQIFDALENIKKAGIKYLMATTFSYQRENEDLSQAIWRPLNLQKPPFNFPEPLELINEKYFEDDGRWSDKCIGVWKMADLELGQKNLYKETAENQNTPKLFNPLVSIIIPVYNGANYVREAIDSALAQTYKSLEIIVVNDGSTDNTEEIAKSYGDKIRYFAKENGGTSTALNLGIKNMRGEYFSWLSHDDMYYPNKIARQIEKLGKLENKFTIMMSDLDAIDEKYEKLYQTNYIDHINRHPLRSKSKIHPVIYNQTHGCTLLIPRVSFDTVGAFDEKQRVAQDFEFFHRAFSKYPHKLISEILVTARDSSNRQGIKRKARCNEEYSALFISIIENLTDEDIKLLAPDKLAFYRDMQDFFRCAGYSIALEYIESKIIKNLQISSYDLIGNKFNGYDLHLQLREKGVASKQLVLYKHSNDADTHAFDFTAKDAAKELLQQKIFLDANIIHLQLVHNIIDLNYLPIISRLKPTILSLHDPFFLGGHCVHHFDCQKWQTQCGDCSYLHEPFELERDISALNFELKKQAVQNSQISALVASRWMWNKVQKSPVWRGKKTYLLPFGINQELFKPVDIKSAKKRLKIPEDAIVLMFRSDPGSFKGLDIIKKALLNLKSSKTIILIAVGQRGLLRELFKKFKILEYDWINDDKLLANLYQACDIFLMPSRQETFGMMAIEAMSCGKMVLALKCKGSALSEAINSPSCGLAASEDDFSRELQKLVDNSGEIVERGKKSLEFARKRYNRETYADKLMEIYGEVIRHHKMSQEDRELLNQLKKFAVAETVVVAAKTLPEPAVPVDSEPGMLKYLLRSSLYGRIGKKVPKKIRTAIRLRLLKIISATRFLKGKSKAALRNLLLVTSPAFRMLQGNKSRMIVLSDKIKRIEEIISDTKETSGK